MPKSKKRTQAKDWKVTYCWWQDILLVQKKKIVIVILMLTNITINRSYSIGSTSQLRSIENAMIRLNGEYFCCALWFVHYVDKTNQNRVALRIVFVYTVEPNHLHHGRILHKMWQTAPHKMKTSQRKRMKMKLLECYLLIHSYVTILYQRCVTFLGMWSYLARVTNVLVNNAR